MNAKRLSAQFAAFVWFNEMNSGKALPRGEAMRFARANWRAFRGCANPGLGKLLIRIGRLNRSKATSMAGT
jgi:hypothetical protein